MHQLLTAAELPEGFGYPAQFVRIVELGLTELEPWHLMEGRELRERLNGLAERYPDRRLVPFARRVDDDDVACWEIDNPGRVVIVHDFASPGWERQGEFENFYGWLRQAVEDLIEYD